MYGSIACFETDLGVCVREIEQAIARRLAFRSAMRVFAMLYGVAALVELVRLLWFLPEYGSGGSAVRYIPFLLPLGISGAALAGGSLTTKDGEGWKGAVGLILILHVPYTLVILGGYSFLAPWISLPLSVIYAGAYAPIGGILAIVIGTIIACMTPRGVKPEANSVLPVAARRTAICVAVGVFLATWLPALGCVAGSGAKGRAALCEAQLKRICEHLDGYARKHEGRLPLTLEDPELGLSEQILRCPNAAGELARYEYIVEYLNKLNAASVPEGEAGASDRTYRVSEFEEVPRRPPWVWERRAFHINDARNARLSGAPARQRCGYGNGTADLLTTEELQEILAQVAEHTNSGKPAFEDSQAREKTD